MARAITLTDADHPLWEGIAFGAGIVLALLLGWRNGDVLWTLWLSSLVFGYATLVANHLGPLYRAHRKSAPWRQRWGLWQENLYGLLFFTVHFTLFHLGHGHFLNMMFPVGGGEHLAHGDSASTSVNHPLSLDFLPLVISAFWPWLIVAWVRERRAIATAWASDGKNVMGPYINVVRMHLLIIGYGIAEKSGAVHGDGFALFVIITLLYFIPWKLLYWLWNRQRVGQEP